MKKLLALFLGLAVCANSALAAVDTRLGGADPKSDAGCYEANTIGGMTCYAQGVAVTTGGTTQYAEDVAHMSADLTSLAGVIRHDTPAALGADLDYTLLQTDANGRLHVLDQNSAAVLTALQLIDNASFNEDVAHMSADGVTLAGVLRQDTPAALGADLDYT